MWLAEYQRRIWWILRVSQLVQPIRISCNEPRGLFLKAGADPLLLADWLSEARTGRAREDKPDDTSGVRVPPSV